ncbi:MAG: arsenate reductase, glutathione/glutaredoxin type [Elainellaceae cyanobacterium]
MKRIMFVCKHNSARSQMAEGFARAMGQGKVAVASAGLQASQIHPGAIAAMNDVGIDISNQTSKPLSDFSPEDFDAVISLCGCRVNLPSQWLVSDIFEDWQLADPAEDSDLFVPIRDQIRENVARLLQTLHIEGDRRWISIQANFSQCQDRGESK